MYTCFFIGHRDAPDYIQEQLDDVVEHLVKMCDVSAFIVGNYGNFDRMATTAVQKLKKRYPDLYAYRMIPYFPEECAFILPELFDDFYYPGGLEFIPRRFAVEKANLKTLENCHYLVSYVCREGGWSAKILRKAKSDQKKGYNIKVFNLPEL